jgi:hypothetical protein
VGALGIRDLGIDPATKTLRLKELNTQAGTSLTLDNFDRYVSLDEDIIRLQDGLKQLLHGESLATGRLARLTSAWREVELKLKEQKATTVTTTLHSLRSPPCPPATTTCTHDIYLTFLSISSRICFVFP